MTLKTILYPFLFLIAYGLQMQPSTVLAAETLTDGAVTFTNASQPSICRLFVSPSQNGWQTEIKLYGDGDLPEGKSITFNLIKSANNLYRVSAQTCDGKLVLDLNVHLAPNRHYTIDWWKLYEHPPSPTSSPVLCPDAGVWPPGCVQIKDKP